MYGPTTTSVGRICKIHLMTDQPRPVYDKIAKYITVFVQRFYILQTIYMLQGKICVYGPTTTNVVDAKPSQAKDAKKEDDDD